MENLNLNNFVAERLESHFCASQSQRNVERVEKYAYDCFRQTCACKEEKNRQKKAPLDYLRFIT